MRQEELEKKIEEAAELANVYKYKSVFIAFSGHGGKKEDQSYIVSNDGVVIWLTDFVNHIVDLFGDEIPKIFLLDSCRGYTELEQRPKRVKRNYLIAYATQDDRVSMLKYDGSYWMPVVARYLREVDDTVVNVIIKANLHVQENHDLKYIQRPVLDDDNFYSGDLKIYQGVEDTDKPPSAVAVVKLTDEMPTMSELMNVVAKPLGTDWHKLGLALGLDQIEDLNVIESQNFGDVTDCCHEMFVLWKRKSCSMYC